MKRLLGGGYGIFWWYREGFVERKIMVYEGVNGGILLLVNY